MGRINLKFGLFALAAIGAVAFVVEMRGYNSRDGQGYSGADKDNLVYAISQELKDPESARVSDVIIVAGTYGNVEACGLVNARNSFGGYTGNRAFHARYNINTHRLYGVMIAEDSSSERIVGNLCSEMLK